MNKRRSREWEVRMFFKEKAWHTEEFRYKHGVFEVLENILCSKNS